MPNDDKGMIDEERRRFLELGLATGVTAMIAGCGGQQGGQETPTPRVETVIQERTVVQTPEPGVEYELVPEFTFQSLPRSNDPQAFEHTVMARQQLAQLGLRFDFEVLETSAWVEDLFSRAYDFNRLTWFGTVERSYPYYNLFFSFHSQFANEQGGNFAMWESEEYDEVVENFNAAFEPEEQQRWAFEAQEILALNQPVLFTVHPDTLVAANTQEFTNWQPMFGTDVYWNINSLRDIEATSDADAVIFGTTEAQESYPNFFAVTGNSLETHKMTYDTPVAYDYDGEIYGLAAEDWEVVDDTTIDVTLRQGMSWHDGEEVTGEDLKWTWDAIQEFGVPYVASDVAPYESSELLDDYTVRFNLNSPFGGFIRISLFRVPILPKHVWDGITDELDLEHPREWSDPDMTGSGPYQFVEYSPGDRIVFERNPDHQFADQIDYDRLIYNVYGSGAPMVGDLIEGRVTFTQGLGPTNYDRAQNADNVTATAAESLATHGVFLRTNIEPFNDVLVRRALAHAINDQGIIDLVFQGRAVDARSPIAPRNEFFYNPDTPNYEHDVAKARELLVEAGLRWNDRGLLVKPVDWEPTVEYVSPED